MKKKFLFALIVTLCCLPLAAQQQKMSPEHKLRYAEALIENFYVDTLDADNMVEEGIRAMLTTLDPHSSYSDAKETEELNTPLQGKFSGVGIQFNMLRDTLYVIQTTAGGPSQRVGIMPGDRILTANDSVISGANRKNSDIIRLLRGKKGTKVDMKVKRGNELIDFRVTRDDIPIHSVDAAYMADPQTGYVRISRFAEDTADEVEQALQKLKKQGMKRLIIDLEDNGGGYLGSAFELSEMFLSRGDKVVSTSGRSVQPMEYTAQKTGKYLQLPLVVMVNQNSASASEIFAGAIQDNDRGVVIGRRTFGKGLVQRPFPFPDGSMIRLTTAHYYTPSGRSIQKPYNLGKRDDYQMDIVDRFNHGELMHADSVKLDRTKPYKTLRLGRTVYGGGGIMPDIFVPLDTTINSKYSRDLTAKNVYGQFVARYLDQHRQQLLRQYPTEDDFYNRFVVTPEIITELTAMGQQEGVDVNPEEMEKGRLLMETIVKALLERDLYEDGSYYRVSNALDPIYQQAVELIASPQRYTQILSPQ